MSQGDVKLSEIGGLSAGKSERTQLRVSRQTYYCDLGKTRDEYVYTPLTIMFFIIGLAFDMYLLLKYTTAEQLDATVVPFVAQIGIVVFMLFGGMVLFVVFVRKIKMQQLGRDSFIAILLGLGLGGILILMQGAVKFLRFSVVPYDYYIMFLSVAISEEFLWRFGVQGSLKTMFNLRVDKKVTKEGLERTDENRTLSSVLSSGISIAITSSIFMLSHIFVYTSGIDLLIIFLVGVGLGIGVEMTKNLDTSIIAHLFLNAIAGYSLIIQYFGGF